MLPLQHVAKWYGLDWDTVKRLDKALVTRLLPVDLSRLQIIAMDEFALRKGHRYATVIVDPRRKRVLWVGKGRGRRTCARIEGVINVPVQFAHHRAFQEQAMDAVDKTGLTSHQWQTRDVVVNLPGFAPAAAVVLAEIHGRMGHFPTILRLRPVHGEGATRYEIAEAINLQEVRDQSRSGR